MISLAERKKRAPLHLGVDVSAEDAAGVSFTDETRSLNVSGGGICFETRRHLVVGSRLTLRIDLPAKIRRYFGGKSSYRVRAIVCRVEHFEGAQASRVGARFIAPL